MKNFFILILLTIFFLTGCSLKKEGVSDWNIKILNYEEKEKFYILEKKTFYDGGTKEIEHSKLPSNKGKFILLNVEFEKLSSKSKLDLSKIKLEINNKKYSLIEDNLFLKTYNYTPITKKDTDKNIIKGILVFEVDKDTGYEKKLLYENHIVNIDEIFRKYGENNFFDERNTNIPVRNDQIENQYKSLEKLKEQNSKKYSFNEPKIIEDPYNYAPLTALIIFDTEQPVQISIKIKGKDKYSEIEHTFTDYKTHHELPILGLYADSANEITLIKQDENGHKEEKKINIRTSELPANFPKIKLIEAKPELMKNGFTMLTTSNVPYSFMVDNNGDVRWYSKSFIYKKLNNGNFIIDDGNTPIFGDHGREYLIELNLLGQISKVWRTQTGAHHDVSEIDGNLIFASNNFNRKTVEDAVVELNYNNGNLEKYIDLGSVFDKTRVVNSNFTNLDKARDWFHLNTVEVVEKNDVLLSSRHQSAVIRYNTGDNSIKWILSSPEKWDSKYKKYLLRPVGNDFEWSWGQHSPIVLPIHGEETGIIDILVFDNGNFRSTNPEKIVENVNNYSRAVQYRIDEKNMTVEQIWEYGKNRGNSLYSASVGNVQYYEDVNTVLVNFGNRINLYENQKNAEQKNISKIIEVTKEKTPVVVYEVDTEFDDKSSIYRAYRYPIYPVNIKENKEEKIEILGDIKTLKEYSKLSEVPKENTDAKLLIDFINISQKSKELEIIGRAYIKNVESHFDDKEIILYNETGYYSFRINSEVVSPAMSRENGDSGDHELSGFINKLDLSEFPAGTYKIGVRIKNSLGDSFVPSDYFLTINGEKKESLVEKQVKIKSELEDKLKSNYTMDNPLIIKDLYDLSPLSAMIYFQTKDPVSVEVIVKGKDEESKIQHKFEEFKTEHRIPILGLYPGIENEVELIYREKTGKEKRKNIKITTESLPENFPKIKVEELDRKNIKQGLIFISSDHGMYAIDINGDVRWYLSEKNFGGISGLKKLKNGNLTVVSETKSKEPYYRDGFYEMTLTGEIVKDYKIKNTHHEILELPTGNFLVLVNNFDEETVEDYMVEVDRKSGEIIKEWNLKKILGITPIGDKTYLDQGIENNNILMKDKNSDEKMKAAIEANKHDWFHQNGAFYDPKDNSIIVSGRNQDMVLKISYDTDEIKWILSDPKDTWPEQLRKKLLKPTGKDFEFQYGQHNPNLDEKGNLLIYDNGNFRSKDYKKALSDKENYSRGVIYKINEVDMSVEQIWEYGKERGNELFTPYIGSFSSLGNNSYLINFGGIILDENRINTSLLYKAKLPNAQLISKMVEIHNGQKVLEVTITGSNTYRINKEFLY